MVGTPHSYASAFCSFFELGANNLEANIPPPTIITPARKNTINPSALIAINYKVNISINLLPRCYHCKAGHPCF